MTDLTFTQTDFQPAFAADFIKRNPFARDLALINVLLEAINNPPAVAEMLRYVDHGVAPLAAVADRLTAVLADLFRQAEADARAHRRANRMRRICGSLVREVLEANGCRKTGRSGAMPEPARCFAKTGALFERSTPKLRW